MSKHIAVIGEPRRQAQRCADSRERDGNSVPAVSIRKAKLLHSFALASRSERHADEAVAWDNLHECFQVKTIDHQKAYSLNGACTHMAEEYFSRLRRAEIGIHHHIASAHLLRYAPESSRREDNRRFSNGNQLKRIIAPGLPRQLVPRQVGVIFAYPPQSEADQTVRIYRHANVP
jgi:ISXO2-like transposase domain